VETGPETTGGGKRRRKHRPRLPRPSPRASVPVYTALKNSLPRWQQLGGSSWVEDTIENGVTVDWAAPPTPFFSAEYPLTPADRAFMTVEIQRELDNG